MNGYQAPVVLRHRHGGGNPHARGGRDHLAAIEGIPVEELVRRHGSPLFVFAENVLRQSHRRIRRAFGERYDRVRFGWSYKTNYLKAVCAVFHDEGSLAEVVSGFEYDKARALGIPGRDIVFNGPHKTREDLQRAIAEGARIQIDHFEELAALETLARGRSEPLPVGIRLHLDAGIHPRWTKFGFALEDGDAAAAVRRIARPGSPLRLAGLHTHLGTCILDATAYRRAAEALVEFADWCGTAHRQQIEWLNLGGGLPSSATLHGQYLPAEQANPPLERYAEELCSPLSARYRNDPHRPLLLLECGRAMVDDAAWLLTTVVASKHTGAGESSRVAAAIDPKGLVPALDHGEDRPAVLVDAGIHLLYTAAWYRLKVRPSRPPLGSTASTRLYGCLCMNIDVIRDDAPLPPCTAGDVLSIHPVGAYAVTQSMQFIAYRPRIVMIGPDGAEHVIRERENLQYVEQLERLPDHLATPRGAAEGPA